MRDGEVRVLLLRGTCGGGLAPVLVLRASPRRNVGGGSHREFLLSASRSVGLRAYRRDAGGLVPVVVFDEPGFIFLVAECRRLFARPRVVGEWVGSV